MAAYILIGVLSAFGALCSLWVLFGGLLPRPKGGSLVFICLEGQEESIVRRYRWLRDLGFLRCPLILLDTDLPAQEQRQLLEKCEALRFYTTEHWIKILKQEHRDCGRAGNGNAAGDHCSGDLPEL